MKAHKISENYVVEEEGKEKICGDDPLRHKNVKVYPSEDPENYPDGRMSLIGNIWEYPPSLGASTSSFLYFLAKRGDG